MTSNGWDKHVSARYLFLLGVSAKPYVASFYWVQYLEIIFLFPFSMWGQLVTEIIFLPMGQSLFYF